MGRVAFVIGLLFAVSCTGGPSAETYDGATPLSFARSPYLGVACPTPSSTVCDRLGIAVWLAEQPGEVWATVNGGERIALTIAEYEDPRGEYAEGFLQPAGLRAAPLSLPDHWEGTPDASVTLRVDAALRSGPATTTVTVGLHPGWG